VIEYGKVRTPQEATTKSFFIGLTITASVVTSVVLFFSGVFHKIILFVNHVENGVKRHLPALY
jgi:hypothetical protein